MTVMKFERRWGQCCVCHIKTLPDCIFLFWNNRCSLIITIKKLVLIVFLFFIIKNIQNTEKISVFVLVRADYFQHLYSDFLGNLIFCFTTVISCIITTWLLHTSFPSYFYTCFNRAWTVCDLSALLYIIVRCSKIPWWQ